jgi:hypothetical protein
MNINFEDFVIKNYSKIGLKKCAEELSTTKGKIQTIIRKNKLKLNKEQKSIILSKSHFKTQEEHGVNVKKFTTDIDKFSAYILGLLWADGYIVKNNSSRQHYISIECVDDDMIFFKQILNKIGLWKYYTRKRGNYRQITKAVAYNKELVKFLENNDYCLKNTNSPDKIINKLPNELIKFFLLGIIDGDGCFYFNKKQYLRQFTICGSLNQDWTAFENIFNSLGITYKINKRMTNAGNSSQLRVLNKSNIKKLGDYIYDTICDDQIGLPRKYNKFLEIIN